MVRVRGQHSGVWGHLSSHLSSHLSFYLLLTVILCQALHVDGWWSKTKGMIEEDASYNSMYYVGKNLTVQCIKFSDFTGEVYFQQGNVNYSQEYVTQINTTHALLDKPVTDDDFEEAYLNCADGDGLVATAHIYTDYAPREANDLKMVWLNEDVLFINWAFNNTSYKNDHTNRLIDITGEWSYNASNANGWNVCYSGDLNNAACNVTGITNQWATVYVRVNMTNVIRNDLVSTVFPGRPIRDHVKPLPVQQVKVVALSSTTARVNVTADRSLLVFHIKYFTMLGDNYITNTLVTNRTSKKSFDIPGLHPDYTYHFEVRCKIDIDIDYLSDLPQSIPEVRMPEDAPSAAPEVEPGSFYLDRSSCKSNDSSQAPLYIYFQEVAEEEKNGNIESYTATVVLDGKNVTYTQSDTPRTVKLDSVPCDGNYDVTLHAHTAVGTSPGAVLHVPRWSEVTDSIVDNVKLKLQWSHGRMTAEWESVAVPRDVSLLLYYCHKDTNDLNMCQSEIGQVNITAGNGSYLVPSADPSMKFGVAAILQDNTTNGIEFTDCIYDPQTDKSTANPFDVEARGLTDSIKVTWDGLKACGSDKQIIVFNYEIKSGRIGSTETEHKTTVVADARDLSFELIDVAKNTNYTITVRANTSSGMTDFSQPAYAVVPYTTSGLNDEEIAGIALAALLVVFILGALVFCFCRDKFRAVKAKFSRSVDIPAPTPRRTPREFHSADHDGSSSRGGITNQGFEPAGTTATVTHQHQDSQDSGFIGNDNSPATPRQVALQGTDSVPPTGPTDLTITDHTQSASPDSNVASTADVTMAECYIQGDDSGGIVSSGQEPAVAESKPFPVPACFGEGDSDEGHDTVGKGIVKDSPSLSDTGSNSYVRFSTEDCPRQGGEHLPGSPAQVLINFSKGKGPATFEPVVGVVHVALSDPGTTPTAANSGNGVDSEAKLYPKKEDDGWAAPAETVTKPTKDVTQDSAMNSVDREVTVSVPEQQGLGSYLQISPSGVTEKSRGQGTQEGKPSDERLEESPATVSPGYVTHDVTSPHAQTDPTRHVNERDASDRLRDEPRPRSQEEPSSFTDTSLSPSAPVGRLDKPRNPANENPEPENLTPQELTPLPADSLPRPLQKPDDPQIDRDINPAPQGHLDQKSADIPPLSAMPGGYVLRHATSPDVSLPCPPPVQDEDDSEGGSQHTVQDEDDSEEGSQHTEKDAARPEESRSSLSESTPSHSSNGGGYVPLDTVEKMTLTLDSSAAMVTADESDAGGREGGGGRGGLERLDSGYSSPNSLQRSPQWRSSPGFTSVQETPHNDNDDGTFNLAPGEPARAPTKTGVAKQSHGERVKGENAGKERGSLGGALVMSSPMRQASSGYVGRNDVFAAPSGTNV